VAVVHGLCTTPAMLTASRWRSTPAVYRDVQRDAPAETSGSGRRITASVSTGTSPRSSDLGRAEASAYSWWSGFLDVRRRDIRLDASALDTFVRPIDPLRVDGEDHLRGGVAELPRDPRRVCAAHQAQRSANARTHRTTAEVPRARFERDERVLLKPLALRPYRSLVLATVMPSAGKPSYPPLTVERRPLAWYDRLARAAR